MAKKSKALFRLGLQAMEGADFHSAIETFEQFIAQEEQNSQAWFYLGLSYLESGYIHRAMGAFQKTIALDPRHVQAHFHMGTAMSASGELDQAAAYYQQALTIDPQDTRAAEQLRCTQALIASRAHYSNALKILRNAQRANGWVSHAMRELVRSLEFFPSSPARSEITTCVGEILASASKRRTAPVVDSDSQWVAYLMEGYDALRGGDWPTAVDAYKKALQRREAVAVAHNALGIAYFRVGDCGRAVEAWLRVMELDPDFDFTRLLP